MEIEFDQAKRDEVWVRRGLAFEDATLIFAGPSLTIGDERFEYGETRFQTFGLLRGRLVNVVWTLRGDVRRIISMRYANDRERRRYGGGVG